MHTFKLKISYNSRQKKYFYKKIFQNYFRFSISEPYKPEVATQKRQGFSYPRRFYDQPYLMVPVM